MGKLQIYTVHSVGISQLSAIGIIQKTFKNLSSNHSKLIIFNNKYKFYKTNIVSQNVNALLKEYGDQIEVGTSTTLSI